MTKEEYLNSDFVTMLHLNNQVVGLSQKNKKLEKENEQLRQENKQLKAQIEKMKSKVSVNLDKERLQGLLAILTIFMDRVSEMENLLGENLYPLYSIAKSIKKDIGCRACVHYGKERDCRGCTKCCNGTCCNLEVAE